MVIIRGTRKFLDRVGPPSEPQTASTTTLGDWFATVVFWRPQLALFVNATTLLPVFAPLAPATTVLDRFPRALAVVLRAHGVAQDIIDRELAETTEHCLTKTNNRSVVGMPAAAPLSRSVSGARCTGTQAGEQSRLAHLPTATRR
jgi:hypothetical protein